MKNFWLGLTLALGVTATTASAQTGYICEINRGTNEGNFVVSPVLFIIDDTGKSGVIMDPVILEAVEKPVPTKIRPAANNNMRINWNYSVRTTSKQTVRISYSGLFDPKTLSFKIRGRINGATNNIYTTGTCRQISQREIANNKWLNK